MVSAIESAIASLASSLPDAAQLMRHADERGLVVATSSRELSGETLSADSPTEVRRYIGKRSDFPTVTKGVAVELGGVLHLVTSARTDPIGASISIGVSAGMDEIAAVCRRSGTKMCVPVRLLAVESESPVDPWSENYAPTSCHSWCCCISAADWTEETEPQIGDELAWEENRVRVAAVAKHGGYWIITARARR